MDLSIRIKLSDGFRGSKTSDLIQQALTAAHLKSAELLQKNGQESLRRVGAVAERKTIEGLKVVRGVRKDQLTITETDPTRVVALAVIENGRRPGAPVPSWQQFK